MHNNVFLREHEIMKIIIINGPNLNLLGKREPEIYGSLSFETFFETLKHDFNQIELSCFQSNTEGELINQLHESGFSYDGIILNAGGYSHTSIALLDAIQAIKTPVIEVHISNIFGREDFRRRSLLSSACKGCIAGLGLDGYQLAIEHFIRSSDAKQA